MYFMGTIPVEELDKRATVKVIKELRKEAKTELNILTIDNGALLDWIRGKVRLYLSKREEMEKGNGQTK